MEALTFPRIMLATAAGLSDFAPESVAFEAGRMVLKRINSLVEQQAAIAKASRA